MSSVTGILGVYEINYVTPFSCAILHNELALYTYTREGDKSRKRYNKDVLIVKYLSSFLDYC